MTKRFLIEIIERGLMPDSLIRLGISKLLMERVGSLPLSDPEGAFDYVARFLIEMATAPVAVTPEKANEQHYGVLINKRL